MPPKAFEGLPEEPLEATEDLPEASEDLHVPPKTFETLPGTRNKNDSRRARPCRSGRKGRIAKGRIENQLTWLVFPAPPGAGRHPCIEERARRRGRNQLHAADFATPPFPILPFVRPE